MAYPNGDTPGIAFPPPLVFVLGFAVGYALQRLFPVTLVPAAGRGVWQGLGWGLVALGAALMGSAVVTFRRAGTTPNPFKPTTAFVTHGPYRFTRNPMYLGLLLTLLAWAVFLFNPMALLFVPIFVLYINRFQIKPEEQVLSSLFGAEYMAYKGQVRRWL